MHPVMFAQDTLWSAQTASCLWYSYTLPGESVPREQTFSATRGSVTKKDVNGTQQTDLLPLGYVQGQRVTVWYNPEDPTNSASLSSDDWRIVGGVLIIIGILFSVLHGVTSTLPIISSRWQNYREVPPLPVQ